MKNRTRTSVPFILFLLLFLMSQIAPYGLVHTVQASPNVSQIYMSPVATCCQANQTTFTVSVMLDLTAGDAINVIDVRLDYTGFWSVFTNRTGVIQAQSIAYTGNIFGSSGDLLFECMDAVQYMSHPCSSDDGSAGQIHFAQGGNTVNGPLRAQLLFAVTFGVHGYGSSVFTFDRADLVNPSPDPVNPSLLNPHAIRVIRSDGIFANTGLGAFFNYAPTVSPVILPGGTVIFDAGMSFNATIATPLVNPKFSWNFGDGTLPLIDQSSTTISHVFSAPGSYRVQLNVTESNGGSSSIVRNLIVVPALGGILLTVRNALGSPIIGGVLVQIFNSSSLTLPLLNKTISNGGQVNFTSLSSGSYFLKFSGSGYQDYSKTETVDPGLTTVDNVYLLSTPIPPQNLTGLIILVAVIIVGLVFGTIAFIVRRRRLRSSSRVQITRSKR